jgi:hypothetical protein
MFLQLSMLLGEDDKLLLKYIRMRCKAKDLICASLVSPFFTMKALFAIHLLVIFL